MLGLDCNAMKMEIRVSSDEIDKYRKFACSLLQCSQVTKRQLFSQTEKVRLTAIACKIISAFARGVEIHRHHKCQWLDILNEMLSHSWKDC